MSLIHINSEYAQLVSQTIGCYDTKSRTGVHTAGSNENRSG